MTNRGADTVRSRRQPVAEKASRSWIAGILLGVVAACVVLVGTSAGLAIGQRDAPSYLSSAESLESGLGYRTPYGDPGKAIDFEDTTSPVVDFPPGYPAVLSLGVMTGADSEMSARVLSAVMVLAITAAVYVTARSHALFRSGFGAVLVALIAAALTLPFTTSALSEPLYGLLLIVTVTATGTYARTRHPGALISATLLAAAATMVRNGGLALVATVVIVTWLALEGSRVRWVMPVVVGVAGVAPFMLTTALGVRELAWHPPGVNTLKIFANAVAGWFVPPLGTPTVRVVVFLFLVAALFLWARPWRQKEEVDDPGTVSPWLLWVPLLAAGAHLSLLFATKALFSSQLNLGMRQLYPVGLALLLASIHYLGRQSGSGSKRKRLSFAALGLSCLLATGWVGVTWLSATMGGSRGYNSEEFLERPTVEFVVDSIPGEKVFSNVPDGLWVAGLSHARPVPTEYDPLSLAVNELKDAEMGRLADSIEDGAVVFYYLEHERDYMVQESELRALAPCVLAADADGLVLSGPDHSACTGG